MAFFAGLVIGLPLGAAGLLAFALWRDQPFKIR